MIQSFAHKGLAKFFYDGSKKGIQAKHAARLGLILDLLNAATQVEDMNFPSSRLHQWEPKSSGIWSVDVAGAWRITFRFEKGDAYEVNYVQPH